MPDSFAFMRPLRADDSEEAEFLKKPVGTYEAPRDGWVCFHCGERFYAYEAAAEHFGESPSMVAACVLGDEGIKARLKEVRRIEASIRNVLKKGESL